MAGETKIIVAEGAVRGLDITVVASNATVIANSATRLAQQIAAEWTQTCSELLEDDGLGLDFANLLGDDPDSEKWAAGNFLE